MATQRKPRIFERSYWCLVCTPKLDRDTPRLCDTVSDLKQHFDDAHPALHVSRLMEEKKLNGERLDAMFLDGARGTYLNSMTDRFSLPDGTPVIERTTIDGNM